MKPQEMGAVQLHDYKDHTKAAQSLPGFSQQDFIIYHRDSTEIRGAVRRPRLGIVIVPAREDESQASQGCSYLALICKEASPAPRPHVWTVLERFAGV
ncbi:hypothetical protein D9C73_024665 [Collichthys lucidus]|uniref:Uncharacterized protein n=1 Tax=Collichthys lucidus TaxID=240159 RepID=A0A4U5VPQ2_COLLU|nr:hypothetical protein D9C73_024665 [Collichthys lucidus]